MVWLTANKLTLNLTKTNYMLVSNVNKLTNKDRKKFRITIGNYTIHEVEQSKYLGVFIDNKLNWNEHIDYLTTKLSQAAGVIYKLRKLIPHRAKMLIYNSLVASYLRYVLPAWGGATATSLKRLQCAQNKIIRFLTHSPPMTNVSNKYHELRIMNINQLYFYEVAKFMHSVYYEYSPQVFHNYFHEIHHNYDTRTRRANTYQLPQIRTEKGKRSLKYQGIHVWAEVPDVYKMLEPKQFSYHLKNYIFTNNIEFNIAF